jgi:hypothetical protein
MLTNQEELYHMAQVLLDSLQAHLLCQRPVYEQEQHYQTQLLQA